MAEHRNIKLALFLSLVISFPQVLVGQQLTSRSTPPPVINLVLPNRENSVRMAVFGDTGRGSKEQYELGRVMLQYQDVFKYDTVIMTGDNIYYEDTPADMKTKFEDAYRPLIDRGVKFYATLGNHDSPNQRFYELFNMKGEEFYRFKKGDVSLYSLNSTYMDKRQLDWLRSEVAKDTNKWRIAFFHHPPFSSGKRHGSETDLQKVLVPVLLSGGIDVVFTGHDHFYERIKPQNGIYYFVAGAGGKIRKGDIRKNSPLTDKGFDADLSFMLVEIAGDDMHFQVVARNGATIDSGVIKRRD